MTRAGTGNTGAMANAVAEGVKSAGAEAALLGPAEFGSDKLAEYDAVAFGCPAMGAEVLEEGEYEPMFASLEGSLSGKKIALFGSYGWGDGQWMRDWEDRARAAGANIITDSVTANNAPDDAALDACKSLGRALA